MFFLFDFTSWRLTEEDHCFRHVKRKLVCVFMVTVTFSLWMNNNKRSFHCIYLFTVVSLLCFAQNVMWSLFVQKKRQK